MPDRVLIWGRIIFGIFLNFLSRFLGTGTDDLWRPWLTRDDRGLCSLVRFQG